MSQLYESREPRADFVVLFILRAFIIFFDLVFFAQILVSFLVSCSLATLGNQIQVQFALNAGKIIFKYLFILYNNFDFCLWH